MWLHLSEFVRMSSFVPLNRSTKSRRRYRFRFQWRLKEVMRLSRNCHAAQLDANWVAYLPCVSGSLGVRWVFNVINNLVMLVTDMLNRLLFYNLESFESAFCVWLKTYQKEFWSETFHTKSGFSSMFIYCANESHFRREWQVFVWFEIETEGKSISEMQLPILEVKYQMLRRPRGMFNNLVTFWAFCCKSAGLFCFV